MATSFRVAFFAVLGTLVMFSGCASKKTTKKQITALQAQVGVITEELARLDQQIQETRAAIQEEENRGPSRIASGESSGNGIYRTPSGFSLPSIDIQRALKNAGYYNGTVDGKIGPRTRDAVKAFQGENGLEADGVIGRTTWGKLKSYLSTAK